LKHEITGRGNGALGNALSACLGVAAM
jgi:hypothetical protein